MDGVRHMRRAFDANAYLSRVEEVFADAPVRETYMARGRVCKNNRDALWYGVPDPTDNMWPAYRIYNMAYGHPNTRAGLKRLIVPHTMPAWMRELLGAMAAAGGVACGFNHVVLHRYVDGGDSIGYHHDKYMDIAPDSTILSLSLGAAREFRVRDEATGRVAAYPVQHGDAIFMTYACNRTKKHGILKTRRACGARYSITARCIDTFFDPATHRLRHRFGVSSH